MIGIAPAYVADHGRTLSRGQCQQAVAECRRALEFPLLALGVNLPRERAILSDHQRDLVVLRRARGPAAGDVPRGGGRLGSGLRLLGSCRLGELAEELRRE